MQGSPDFAIVVAIIEAAIMVVILVSLCFSDPTKRKLFCWIRGGHQFELHPVNQARIFHNEARATHRTHVCARRYCGIQRELPITMPL